MTSRLALLLLALLPFGGCAQTFKEIGQPPSLSDTGSGLASAAAMTMQPPPPAQPVSAYSTWADQSSNLFIGKRALATGDILTVQIAINDKAQLTNKSDRSRSNTKSLGLTGSYDVNGAGGAGSASGDLTSATDFSGTGGTTRSETIKLAVAAVVTGIMPNGNLFITGSQEVRVNAELRVLTLTGIVRPSDIGPNNTISYERIAEARISYGGRGRITEVQQPPYGQQILDIISPL